MGLNDFKLEEPQGSGVAFPFVKSSIRSVFQDFSQTRITFDYIVKWASQNKTMFLKQQNIVFECNIFTI